MTRPDPRHVREAMPIHVYRLGDEPGNDLSAQTTAAERLQMVAELSERFWALTGNPTPTYSRAKMPGTVGPSR
jgi:hypothetical protein